MDKTSSPSRYPGEAPIPGATVRFASPTSAPAN